MTSSMTEAPVSTDLDTAREMLVLSMLSYRAYYDLRPGEVRLAHLREAVTRGLDELELVRDWELVWGPAAYRAPFTVFDENVLYIVRRRSDPTRFAVVIRGTNPLSPADWLFGDLWTGLLAPWELGEPESHKEAAVSLSTALGLNVLLHLHDPGPSLGPVALLWRGIDGRVGDVVRSTSRAVLAPFGGAAAAVMQLLRFELRGALREVKNLREVLARAEAADRIEAMLDLRSSKAVRRLLRKLAPDGLVIDPKLQRDALGLLEGSFRFRTRFAPGTTAVEFLRSCIRKASGPVEVTVTGHSKGGAVAPAFALALEQLRGKRQVPRRLRWDPDERATVQCYSFAGPTPGNAAFAALFDHLLGSRSHRIANRLDIVPHAWMTGPTDEGRGLYVERIPTVYGDEVHAIPGLAKLAKLVAGDVGPLDYAHVGGNVTLLDGVVDPGRHLFLDQVAYQHMEAYLELLGLEQLGVGDFFAPLDA